LSTGIAPGVQRLDETVEPRKIVAGVGVAHNNVAPPSRLNARRQRGAVTSLRDVDHACPETFGDPLRTVLAAVVRHQHLAADAAAGKESGRLLDAHRQRAGLVEARHEDRELAGGESRRVVIDVQFP
jgi:hypothetical protein